MKLRNTRAKALTIAMTGALLLAACGDDSGSSGSATGSSSATGSTADASTATAASGQPITIGFVNMEDGTAAQPTLGDAAEAARRYINDTLGGVDGRPIEFVKCSTSGAPESSAQCATRMVTAGVPLVYQGFDSGNTALHPILKDAGIPWVGQEPFSASDYQQGYFFSGSQVAYALGAGQYLRDEVKPERVVILSYTTPTALAANDAYLKPSMEASGAQVEIIHVEYGAPDISVPVSAAMATKPDAIVFFMGDADCTKVIIAADQLGYDGTIIAGSCSDFATDAGAAAEGVVSFADVHSVADLSKASPRAKADVAAFVEAMEEHAPGRAHGLFNQFVFAGLVNLATVLNTIDGDITKESVAAALADTEDVPSFMSSTFGCKNEVTALAPSVCAANILALTVKDGSIKQLSDDFIFGPALFG